MIEKDLKLRRVNPFGLTHHGTCYWHDALAQRVGLKVYVTEQPFDFRESRLIVFDDNMERVCNATELHDPRRLLRSFEKSDGGDEGEEHNASE